jgi:hypothetical protein
MDVAADVDRDPVQPRRELPPRIEAVEVAEDTQENLLRGVAGILEVAEQRPGGSQDAPLVCGHELLERLAIAGAGPFDDAAQVGVRAVLASFRLKPHDGFQSCIRAHSPSRSRHPFTC